MTRSKRISDETIKSIMGWTFCGLIAFLFFANSVGFVTALGTIFFVVPLSLPFVFLIIGTRKDSKPVSFVNASRQPVRGSRQAIGDCCRTGGGGSSSLWDNDRPLFGSCFDDDYSSNSHFDNFPSSSCFDDDSSIISSSNDLSHDIFFAPEYSSLDCNIYHHDN